MVIPPDDVTMRLSSTSTPRGRSRNTGANHQLVVARRPSRTPDSARTNVPVQAEAIGTPRPYVEATSRRAAPVAPSDTRATSAPGSRSAGTGTISSSASPSASAGGSASTRCPRPVRTTLRIPATRMSNGGGGVSSAPRIAFAECRMSRTHDGKLYAHATATCAITRST